MNANSISNTGTDMGGGAAAAAPTTTRKLVYTVVDTKNGKAIWVRIGVAFTNRDGSLNLKLDALPVNGQLQVREEAPWEERRPSLANTSPAPHNEAFA